MQVPVRDDRFRAVQALRFMGYALATAGDACPALWDAAQPRTALHTAEGDSGRRVAKVCSPLPEV